MPPETRLGFWCCIHVEDVFGLLKLLVMGLLNGGIRPSWGEAFISVFSLWKSGMDSNGLTSSMIDR